MPSKEQRNTYVGDPARACMRLALHLLDNAPQEAVLLVDTGSPCPLIIGEEALRACLVEEAADVMSNFGLLKGGWSEVTIDRVGVTLRVKTYGSDAVVAAVRQSAAVFHGLAGLPLVRMLDYGGDSEYFWLRRARRSKNRAAAK
jgi:hypothetical protein